MSIQVRTEVTSPEEFSVPSKRCLPLVKVTATAPRSFFTVAPLAIAACTKPCGVDSNSARRSSTAAGALVGAAFAPPTGVFQARLPAND